MIIKLCISLLFCFVIGSESADDTVLVSLSSDDVIKTFKSVVASGFLNQLAERFATKAAERFIQQMKLKQKAESNNNDVPSNAIAFSNRQRPPATENHQPSEAPQVLNEAEALALIQDPSPDGDNLEQESPYLSEEDIGATKPVPVVGVMKINGVYFRRYLGDLNVEYKE